MGFQSVPSHCNIWLVVSPVKSTPSKSPKVGFGTETNISPNAGEVAVTPSPVNVIVLTVFVGVNTDVSSITSKELAKYLLNGIVVIFPNSSVYKIVSWEFKYCIVVNVSPLEATDERSKVVVDPSTFVIVRSTPLILKDDTVGFAQGIQRLDIESQIKRNPSCKFELDGIDTSDKSLSPDDPDPRTGFRSRENVVPSNLENVMILVVGFKVDEITSDLVS